MKNNILSYSNHLKKLYVQMFQQASKIYQLNQVEIDVLLFLYNNPEYNTARDVCVMRGIAKSNVSTAVESLSKRGFLASQVDLDNRKLHRLTLCAGTDEMMKELQSCQEQCIALIVSGFSQEEMELMKQFQKRMDENIVTALKRAEEKRI